MANKIIVQDTPITVIKQGTEDYICLTDMLQAKDGDFFVTDWLRNRNNKSRNSLTVILDNFFMPLLLYASEPTPFRS